MSPLHENDDEKKNRAEVLSPELVVLLVNVAENIYKNADAIRVGCFSVHIKLSCASLTA